MPTFNQLVRKGRQTSERNLQHRHFRKDGTPFRSVQLMYLHHRREVFVQQLRQLHLRSLTQL